MESFYNLGARSVYLNISDSSIKCFYGLLVRIHNLGTVIFTSVYII